LGCEFLHSPPPAVEVKNDWTRNSILPYAFMYLTGIYLFYLYF
jgi:hypothetical protein